MWITKVAPKGGSLQTTLPRGLCKELGIERGDLLAFSHLKRDEITIIKITPEKLDALKAAHGENIKIVS